MSNIGYPVVSGLLFCFVAIAHLLRIFFGASVQVDDYLVPMAVSYVGFIVPAALAFWAFSLCTSRTRDCS
mgnify:CR=1 FL=1